MPKWSELARQAAECCYHEKGPICGCVLARNHIDYTFYWNTQSEEYEEGVTRPIPKEMDDSVRDDCRIGATILWEGNKLAIVDFEFMDDTHTAVEYVILVEADKIENDLYRREIIQISLSCPAAHLAAGLFYFLRNKHIVWLLH